MLTPAVFTVDIPLVFSTFEFVDMTYKSLHCFIYDKYTFTG